MAMNPTADVRKELDMYGREGTGKKFMEVLSARRSMILQQRQKGLGGMIGGIKAMNSPSDQKKD
jgi:hypothetical protein